MTNKPFGVEELNVVGSAGTALIESVTDLHIRVGGGCTVGIGTSGVNIQDGTADANNDSVLNAGIVTANTYYGNFKGTIDPITSSITLNANLTDLLGISGNELSAVDANADKIMFWDDDPGKATYLTVGTGLSITGTTLTATTDAGKTYTLPVTGTTGGDGVGEATWTLTDNVTPTPGTDPVTLKAGANISIGASNVGTGEFTISAVQGAGLTLDATVTDVLDLTSGILSADDPGADRIIFWDETATKLTHLTVGTGLSITGTTMTATSDAGKTYTLEGVDAAPNFTLRLSDTVTDDDVTFTAGTNISFGSTTTDGVTINAIAGAGMDTDATTADVLTITGAILSADDPGADRIVFWDESETKLTHLTVGTGLSITGTTMTATSDAGKTYTLESVDDGDNAILRLSDGTTDDDVTITAGIGITIDPVSAGGFTISANSSAGKSYTLPLTGATGSSGHATWTLTPDTGTSNAIKLNAGNNVSISALDVTGPDYEFTIDVASGAGITFTGIAVKQYSDNAIPRTERTCADPIVVNVDGSLATIGIGNTSNAYGERYIQATEPTSSCDGDIWYDTSSGGGGIVTVPVGGIIMWSGTQAALTALTNWKLCDGTTHGSITTPDLRNKFIIAAKTYDTGTSRWQTDIEGSDTADGGSKDAIVPYHNHTTSGGTHEHTYKRTVNFSSGGGDASNVRAPFQESDTSTTGGGAHSHTISHAGDSGNTTNANLPPYYALAFIQRIS